MNEMMDDGMPLKLNEFADCTKEDDSVLLSKTAKKVKSAEEISEESVKPKTVLCFKDLLYSNCFFLT
jgi:hypothetical protein